MDSQSIYCACFWVLSLSLAVDDVLEELGHVGFGVVDTLQGQTKVHLFSYFAQSHWDINAWIWVLSLFEDLLCLQARSIEVGLSVWLIYILCCFLGLLCCFYFYNFVLFILFYQIWLKDCSQLVLKHFWPFHAYMASDLRLNLLLAVQNLMKLLCKDLYLLGSFGLDMSYLLVIDIWLFLISHHFLFVLPYFFLFYLVDQLKLPFLLLLCLGFRLFDRSLLFLQPFPHKFVFANLDYLLWFL